jgi:Tol biopolymer transport system component
MRDVNWSPDGDYLAFAKDEIGECSIYVMDTKTWNVSETKPWALGHRCFHSPTWSPDSRKLAFFGRSSHGEWNPFPWPPEIDDELYIAERGEWKAKQRTEDLGETNPWGASWCGSG